MHRASIVLLDGIVRGMGREEPCDILARRIDNPDLDNPDRHSRFIDCSVLTAPADLPNGEYIALFSGHRIIATRKYGLWLPGGEAVRDDETERLGSGRFNLLGPALSPSRPSFNPVSEADQSPEVTPSADSYRQLLRA